MIPFPISQRDLVKSMMEVPQQLEGVRQEGRRKRGNHRSGHDREGGQQRSRDGEHLPERARCSLGISVQKDQELRGGEAHDAPEGSGLPPACWFHQELDPRVPGGQVPYDVF